MTLAAEHPPVPPTPLHAVPAADAGAAAEVVLTRTPAGWAVRSPAGEDAVDGLVEGMSLADLVTEELGGSTECAPAARRSARGPVPAGSSADVSTDPDALDPRDLQVAALARTVAQLEHALAARVATERAIGVLAERHGWSPREGFESLRRTSRSERRPVQDVAAGVLAELAARTDAAVPAPTGELPAGGPPAPRTASDDVPAAVPAGDPA